MGHELQVLETGPTPGETAELLLEREDAVRDCIISARRALLLNADINADLVGRPLEEVEEVLKRKPFSEALDKIAPHGLRLFALLSNQPPFEIARERAEDFLEALLRAPAELKVRHETRKAAFLDVQEALQIDDGPNSTPTDVAASLGIFDGKSTHGALYELPPEESAPHDANEARQLLTDLVQLLQLRFPTDSDEGKSLRKWCKEGAHLIDAAFPVPEAAAPAATAAVATAVDKAFETYVPNASKTTRIAYAGIIASLLGLTEGALDPASAYERARRALSRHEKEQPPVALPSEATAVEDCS